MTRVIALVFACALIWAGMANASHACVVHACDEAGITTGHDDHAPSGTDKAGDKLVCKFACHAQSVALTTATVAFVAAAAPVEQPDFVPGARTVPPVHRAEQPPRNV